MAPDPSVSEPARHGEAIVRALRSEEREACLDLWCTVWPGENSRAYFRRYFYGDVDWLPYYTQVVEIEGRLVSAVQICRRVVACGDLQLTMGGIANVATDPAFRGRGYSTACLQQAVRVMEADAMDFSLLFTGIHGFYAREGFVSWTRPRRTGIRPHFAGRPTGLQVQRARDADLPAIQALYADFNRTRPITVQRTPAYWRDWIGMLPSAMAEPPLIVWDKADRPAGYVVYRLQEKEIAITEIGIATETDAITVAVALLTVVAQRAIDTGRSSLSLHGGLEPVVLAALDRVATTMQADTFVAGMVRLLHRDSLLRGLIPELTDRWITAGRPPGILTFETPYGLTELNADGPFLRVHMVEAGETVLSQEALFGLLFGSLAPEQATSETRLHPLLHALFPRQGVAYWSADGF